MVIFDIGAEQILSQIDNGAFQREFLIDRIQLCRLVQTTQSGRVCSVVGFKIEHLV